MGVPVTTGMKFQVNYRMTYQGKNYQLTFWYQAINVATSEDSDTASATLFAGLNTGLFASLAAFISSSITIVQTTIQVVAPVRVRANYYQPTAVVGAGPATTTGNLAAVVSRYGTLSGRKYIAHSHVPAPDDDTTMAGGSFTVAARTLLGNIATAMLAGVMGVGNNWAPVINNGKTISTTTFLAVTTFGNNVRVMRRRTVGLKVTRRRKKPVPPTVTAASMTTGSGTAAVS